jgi:Flp pilus assembly pilin Flp
VKEISIRIHILVASAASSFATKLKHERGQDLIEYALIGGLIAAALLAAFLILGPSVSTMATNIGNCVDFNKSTTCIAGP